MAPQRRIDVVNDSVKRLLRMGATANLLNLLQKQHPADLAQVLTDLAEKDRHAAFNLLVDAEQTAGRIMNPKVFALAEDMTAGEAITTLQTSRDVEMVFYLYVIDSRPPPVGVVSLPRAPPGPPHPPPK